MEINDVTIPLLSSFAAVAIVETVRALGIENCGIKAPNDVLISGRKTAGVLVETRTGRFPFAVVGIGLNVNHRRSDFPVELQDRAGSLAMASGHLLDRHQIAKILLQQLSKNERLMQSNPRDLLAAWDAMLIPIKSLSECTG